MQSAVCALTLLAGIVGAGFASGREIVRFFSSHGAAAAAAVVSAAAALLFFFLRLCAKMEKENADGVFSLCRARFGKRLGTLCGALFFLLSAVTAGAMLAACAELCALVLPLRHAYGIGMAASLFLGLFLARRGAKGLALAGAALLCLLPLLLLRLLFLPAGEACFLPAMTPDLPVRAVADGVSYAALNAALLLGAQPVLLSVPARTRKRGVMIFSALFTVLLSLSCAVCLRHAQAIALHPMPFVYLSRRLGGGYVLVAVCMYAAALSTLCTLCTGLMGMIKRTSLASAVICGAVILAFSRIGFGALVQSAYPVLGAVCAGLLILLCA